MDIPYKVFDNVFSEEYTKKILKFCTNSRYSYGECDEDKISGLSKNIIKGDSPYKLFSDKILELCPEVKDLRLGRMYINCFAPNENTHFHTDGSVYTFIYYPHDDWNLSEGGETQFYVDGTIIGSVPKPNRMIMFEGESLLHRAMSFRDRYRFSIALKYEKWS